MQLRYTAALALHWLTSGAHLRLSREGCPLGTQWHWQVLPASFPIADNSHMVGYVWEMGLSRVLRYHFIMLVAMGATTARRLMCNGIQIRMSDTQNPVLTVLVYTIIQFS